MILGVGIGVLITAQWKTKPQRISDPVVSYASLNETRENLTVEQKALKSELNNLQDVVKQDQNELKKRSVNRPKVEELEKYREKVGLTEIKGKGIIISLDDSRALSASEEAITHAADLRDIVNFLWGLEAQAISVNGERIVYSTSIDCLVNTVLINNTKTTPPFKINALGNPDLFTSALKNDSNLKDINKRVKNDGLVFSWQEEKEITVPAYRGNIGLEYAKISQ